MQDKKYILMSIKPVYAEQIKSGQKTIELRRIAPKVKSGDVLIIYESSPVKQITAFCEIEAIVVAEPNKLWETAKGVAGLSYDSFIKYFDEKSQAVGIKLGKVKEMSVPKGLSVISIDMQAPQSYRYLSREQFQILTE